MDTYIKTIINGLKSWVSSRLTRLETSVSGSLADLANKLTSLSNKVSKNTKDISQAQSTANAAQSMADNALQKSGGNMTGPLRMNGNVVINENGEIIAARSLGIYPKDYTQSFGSFLIVKDPDAKTMVWVDRDSVSGTGAPSTIKFIANGSAKMNVEGIHTIQMNSPSGKKFDITVSDDGTITTTEVTA